MRALAVVVALSAALAGGACSGGGGEAPPVVAREARSRAPVQASAREAADVPVVTVTEVGSAAEVALPSLFPADRPVLLWFWAPSCTSCAAEAPGLTQFAGAHAADIAVIGLGAHDSYAEAEEFVNRHKVPFRMLWDPGYESWLGFGIQRQPASILLSPAGTRVRSWHGALDDAKRQEVLRLAAASSTSVTPG